MPTPEQTVIELAGVKLTILDEPNDVQVWVSLQGSDVPQSSECFCFAGGDTREEAIGLAIRLFRECADKLAATA